MILALISIEDYKNNAIIITQRKKLSTTEDTTVTYPINI
jgi:hypothetical protein